MPAPERPITSTSLAAYDLQTISFAHQLADGHVLVGVLQGIDAEAGKPLEPGLLVVPPDDEPYYIVNALINNSGLIPDLDSTPIAPARELVRIKPHVVRILGHPRIRIQRAGRGTTTWEANPA